MSNKKNLFFLEIYLLVCVSFLFSATGFESGVVLLKLPIIFGLFIFQKDSQHTFDFEKTVILLSITGVYKYLLEIKLKGI